MTVWALTFVALGSTSVWGQTYSTMPLQTWGVNGAVNAVERVGNRLFVAGNFTRASRTRGGVVSISGFTGELRGGFNPRIPSGVSAIAADGRGGWYIGGEFGQPAGLAGARLVRVLADGDIDTSFVPAIAGEVTDIAVAPDRVFIAGGLSAVNGQTSGAIAALDPQTGANLGFRTAVRQASRVHLLSGGRLLVFGNFDTIGGLPRTGLAMVDATTGQLLLWAPDIPGFTSGIGGTLRSDFSVVDDTVYVCGAFSVVNGQARRGLAAIDLTSGDVLPWNPQAVTSVDSINGCSLTTSGDRLFLIRDVTVNNSVRVEPYAINRTTGIVFAEWQPPVAFTVGAPRLTPSLFAGNGKIYFYNSTGLSTGEPYVNLWAVDPVMGLVDSAFVPRPAGLVRAVATNGGDLMIGGNFTGVDSVARQGVLALDLDTDSLVDWNPLPAHTQGRGFAVAGGRLFVHGLGNSFELGAFDLVTLQAVPWPRIMAGSVIQIGAVAGRVIVAGRPHSPLGSGEALLILDPISGARATPPLLFWGSGFGLDVQSIGAANDRVYIAGFFSQINGHERGGFAAIDVNSGGVLPWAPQRITPIAPRLMPGPGLVAIDSRLIAPYAVDAEIGFVVGAASVPPLQHWEAHDVAGPLVALNVLEQNPAVDPWRVVLDYTTRQVRWFTRGSPPDSTGPGTDPGPLRMWEDVLVVAGGTRVGTLAAGYLQIFPSARPLAPDNVAARFVPTGSVPFAELSWSHPTLASVTGFIVEVGSAPGRIDLGSFGIAATTVVQAAHPPRGTYYLRVRAVNADGIGPPSREVRLVVP